MVDYSNIKTPGLNIMKHMSLKELFVKRNTDKEWIRFGKMDPYFGVLTFDEYHSSNMDASIEKEFWQTGRQYFREITSVVHKYFDSDFTIRRGLDFGCGVGRVLIPMAEVAAEVVGVDISDGMLETTRKNCDQRDLRNVVLVKSDDTLSQVSGNYDFVHSFIVLQHIPVKRGMAIFRELIQRLDENGVGVIHFTYDRIASPANRFIYSLINRWGILSGIWNLARGKPYTYPIAQMHQYDLNKIFRTLQETGCHNVHLRFTNHMGIHLGVILFFQKSNNCLSGIE